MNIQDRKFSEEFVFKASRSGGKGGQHVNKVSTKVELFFNVKNSLVLTNDEKKIILKKLTNKIDKKGLLRIVSQSERSQIMNKKKAVHRFYEIIEKSLKKKKVRKKTKPTQLSKVRRLSSKKIISEKKKLRIEPSIEE
ncbi:MAG: aminoacyl-tRNA hydrolase [Ignavibacteria bacterium]|nr:aminoacyl-tRNA hydrolase [Ignavibacteria bacterium]